MFKIPIKEYEQDIDENFSKEKKNEVLDLLTNYNKLRSEGEFKEIERKLHIAFKLGNIDLIKIYISETIKNNSEDLTFKIDETTKTASLFKVSNNIKQLNIPRTVQYKSTEYLITSITGAHNNNIKTIKFAEDSAVNTIHYDAFSWPIIEEFYLPASLRELEKGWCYEANKLKKIIISPSNGQFMLKEDKILLSKTDSNSDIFDNLLFAFRDIDKVSIPSDITNISMDAFHSSAITEIFIPSKVSVICENAFADCRNLRKVEFAPNSNLHTIKRSAFHGTKIEKIFIPSKVSKICDYAFYNCPNLKKFELTPDSNLQAIEAKVFSYSNIEKIYIPPKVLKICNEAFSRCSNLKKIEIPQNSNLQTIESNAFFDSTIEEIYLPASLRELNGGWNFRANQLKKITISPLNDHFIFYENKILLGKTDQNSNEFDNILFVTCDIKRISIPSNVKIIKMFTFSNCHNLTSVEIPQNSNLQTIEKYAFPNIDEIFIPSKVSKIYENAFLYCMDLQIVEISEESELGSFPLSAFNKCSDCIFMIPSSLPETFMYSN